MRNKTLYLTREQFNEEFRTMVKILNRRDAKILGHFSKDVKPDNYTFFSYLDEHDTLIHCKIKDATR